MGICNICHTEQPEVFKENPICWNCGMDHLFKTVFNEDPFLKLKSDIKNTASENEVDLKF